LLDRGASLLVAPLDLEGNLRPARGLPGDLLLLEDPRLVLLGVDLDLEEVRGRSPTGARDDLHGLARRELAVHAGRRDADALLPPAHPQAMELGSVEELREDRRDLLAHDPGPVVGDRDAEAARLTGGRRGVPVAPGGLELDDHVGEDAGLLARVQRV